MATPRVARALVRAVRATRVIERVRDAPVSLFALVANAEGRGIGSRVVKASWTARPDTHGDTFWTLTRVRTRPSGRSGEVYGVLTWKGRTREEESRINGSMKRIWSALASGENARAGPTLRAPGTTEESA